jgi:hypothetical protein
LEKLLGARSFSGSIGDQTPHYTILSTSLAGLGPLYVVWIYVLAVATLLLEEWEDDTHTPEMGTWESVGTPKTSEFDFKGQNTSY